MCITFLLVMQYVQTSSSNFLHNTSMLYASYMLASGLTIWKKIPIHWI